MKRYRINDELKCNIRNSPYSFGVLSSKLGFDIKNIYYVNKSISEIHLKKLNAILNLNLVLKEIKFDTTKNLGKYSSSWTIKPIRKNKNIAEFIGIMLGDGNLYLGQIRIFFDARNVGYIKYVENLGSKLFGIKFKRYFTKETNQARIYCYSERLSNKLVELGLRKGNKKKNQVGIPNWVKENKAYSRACIRGLIDTDGCIYKCKREKQVYVKFTNHNIQLLSDFKEVTKNLGYSFAKSNATNTCLYRKNEVVSFINEIRPFKAIGGMV